MTIFFHLHRQGRLGKLKSWFCTWWNNLNCFLTIIDLNLWLSHTFHCKMEQYVQESLLLYQSRCKKAILDNQLLFQCLDPDLFVCLWLWYKKPTTPIRRQWKSYLKSGHVTQQEMPVTMRVQARSWKLFPKNFFHCKSAGTILNHHTQHCIGKICKVQQYKW